MNCGRRLINLVYSLNLSATIDFVFWRKNFENKRKKTAWVIALNGSTAQIICCKSQWYAYIQIKPSYTNLVFKLSDFHFDDAIKGNKHRLLSLDGYCYCYCYCCCFEYIYYICANMYSPNSHWNLWQQHDNYRQQTVLKLTVHTFHFIIDTESWIYTMLL